MTTSAYIALVDPLLTVAELLEADLRATLKIGRALITYAPRADQPLSLEHTIEAFTEKQPANGNEPQEEAAEPRPAFGQGENAELVEFMKTLKEAPDAPRQMSEMAADWLKQSSRPGAEFRGRRIVKQAAIIWPRIFQLISRQAAAILNPPGAGRAQLKNMYNDIPAPKSIQLTTRLALEGWKAHHPQPKNGWAA